MSVAGSTARSPVPNGDDKGGLSGQGTPNGSRAGSRPQSGASKASKKSGAGSKAGSKRDAASPAPSVDNMASDWRTMRRIIAEDPEWSLQTVPLLWELCIKHIVDNFAHNSKIINRLLPKHKAKVLEKLPVDLPLSVTAPLVEDEAFWQKCCKNKWEVCDVTRHGGSWKRMFLERHLQRLIELYVPGRTDMAELESVIPLAAPHVVRLEVRQLLPPVKDPQRTDEEDEGSDAEEEEPEVDHFDFGPMMAALPKLEELSVCYGVKDCGMNFEWSLFQFTAKDCLSLAKNVAATKYLQCLQLHRSKVDDDKVRVLISHMLDHPNLRELDLSHNLISDRGARAIGKFLNNHSILVELDLCDNQIRAAGAQAIAHALTKNSTLEVLSLRLNQLGDEGGQAVCRAMLRNNTLRQLNLAGNNLTEPTAAILSQVVTKNDSLTGIDISCNRLGPDGGKQLQEGMDDNYQLVEFDLRHTECGNEADFCVAQILQRNIDKQRAEASGERLYGIN